MKTGDIFKKEAPKMGLEMPPSARQIAIIAFLALLPFGVYSAYSGEMTAVNVLFGVANVVIIGASILVMFGAADEGLVTPENETA